MNKNYIFEKGYRDNCVLRGSFNTLAGEVFGLNFEPWFQNGYWKEQYIPYSMINEGKVIANASANVMRFIEDGDEKKYIQIGTVMTHEYYRNQGLARFLMEKIIDDYVNEVDGIYLFGSDSVINFYPKFGFEKCTEFQYLKKVVNYYEMEAVMISMENRDEWERLENVVENGVSYSAFEMTNDKELVMFYIINFMRTCVYYIRSIDTYVIAEIKGETLIIHSVYSDRMVDLNKVIKSFGKTIRMVILEFKPYDVEEFDMQEFHREDSTLFAIGKDFQLFEERKLIFPYLTHT